MNIKKNKCIFLVDDDPFWTMMLSQVLSDLGYQNIFKFKNGSDCLQHLSLLPDTVFLDYKMDDVNGLEVLRRIKAYSPSIDVIFCSAYEDLRVALSALDQGSFEYLLKLNATKEEVESVMSRLSEFQLLEGSADIV